MPKIEDSESIDLVDAYHQLFGNVKDLRESYIEDESEDLTSIEESERSYGSNQIESESPFKVAYQSNKSSCYQNPVEYHVEDLSENLEDNRISSNLEMIKPESKNMARSSMDVLHLQTGPI